MRATIAGAIAVAVAVPAVAGAATIRPTVRVEGASRVVVPQMIAPVSTTGTITVADTTDTDTIAVPARSATAQVGVLGGQLSLPLAFDLFDFGGPSSFITRIGADQMPPTFSPSWRLKVNHKTTSSGSDTTALASTDSVLWSFVANFDAPELDVTVTPRKVRTGGPVKVHVVAYDNNGVATPASGATVRFSGKTKRADANGDATFRASVPGVRFAAATATGAVRSPRRLVCVGRTAAACSAVTVPVAGTTPPVAAIAGLTTGARVEISVQRLGAVAPGCTFLTRARTAFATSPGCSATWIPVTVTGGHWLLQLRNGIRLAPGRYIVRSRAITGTSREPRQQAGGNLRRLTVVAP